MTFESVRISSEELALAEAITQIANQSQQFDDLLASGASLEELAIETPLELKEIAFFLEWKIAM